jgi:hypothetical protein
MRKLLFAAAALMLVASVAPAFVGQAQAAKDPLCSNPYQGANQSWAEHYGCWKETRAVMTHHHHRHHA